MAQHVVAVSSDCGSQDETLVRDALSEALQNAGLEDGVYVSVAFVDSNEMTRLNRDFHHINRVTDVLSFPFLDPQSNDRNVHFVEAGGVQTLGEIVVCCAVAKKQAEEKGKTYMEEVLFLVDHGLQHLLGNHHD